MLELFDYGFAENGLTAYRLGQPIASQVPSPSDCTYKEERKE